MPVPSFRPFWTQQVPGIFEREGGGFFSKLAQLLTEKMPQRAYGLQVLGIAQGAKPAEAEWIGLSRFLDPKQQYMKPDVLRYVQERSPSLEATPRLAKLEHPRIIQEGPISATGERAVLFEPERVVEHRSLPSALFQNPDYQLPGGKAYREIPVRIGKEQIQEQYPKIVQPYLQDVEGHYSSNTVFHMRTTDRQLPTGEKVLFGEEIQSDWHQKARAMKEEGGMGYIPREIGPRVAEEKIKLEEAKTKLGKDVKTLFSKMREVEHASAYSRLSLNDPEWDRKYGDVYKNLYDQYVNAMERLAQLSKAYRPEFGGALPVGPFEKSWPELSIKKMLNDAVARGYDGIGWTTGDQQLRRYASLSERVGTLRWEKTPNGYALYAQGQEFGGIDPKDLSSWVGASAAKKILAGEGVNKLEATNPRVLFRGVGNVGLLEGEEIQLGGKGMRRFYDEILPNTANNYAKKWGVKVQDRDISTSGEFMVDPSKLALKNVTEAHMFDRGQLPGYEDAYYVLSDSGREGKAIATLFPQYAEAKGRPLTRSEQRSGYVVRMETTFRKELEHTGLDHQSVLRVFRFLERPYKTKQEAFKEIKQAITYLKEQASRSANMAQIHYLPITPQMRKDILTKGQPLWQFAPSAIGLGAGATALSDQQESPS